MNSLPNEILYMIFQYLRPCSVTVKRANTDICNVHNYEYYDYPLDEISVAYTCRKFHDIITHMWSCRTQKYYKFIRVNFFMIRRPLPDYVSHGLAEWLYYERGNIRLLHFSGNFPITFKRNFIGDLYNCQYCSYHPTLCGGENVDVDDDDDDGVEWFQEKFSNMLKTVCYKSLDMLYRNLE